MKHRHIYRKTNIGKKTYDQITKRWQRNIHWVYKCVIAECPHYTTPELLVDRIAECCRCHLPFKVTRKLMKNVDVHCEDCYHDKKFKAAEDLLNDLTLEN